MSILDTQLTLPSDPYQVAQVQPFVDEVAQRYKLDADTQGNILISLTEAVTNAMLHGNRGDRNKMVSISLRCDKNKHLSVRVTDQGEGFNLDQIPDPTGEDHLEKCGGRGLFLMRHLSDECRFLDSEKGTVVEMRFKI
jgi:serine/threonine-protein kinase RsbW